MLVLAVLLTHISVCGTRTTRHGESFPASANNLHWRTRAVTATSRDHSEAWGL